MGFTQGAWQLASREILALGTYDADFLVAMNEGI